jgi:hypothetical protein
MDLKTRAHKFLELLIQIIQGDKDLEDLYILDLLLEPIITDPHASSDFLAELMKELPNHV